MIQQEVFSVKGPTGLLPVTGGTPPKGGSTGPTAFVAGLLALLGQSPSSYLVDGMFSPVGAAGAGASMATAPAIPSYARFLDSTRSFAVNRYLMDTYEVFGDKSFADAVAKIRGWTYGKYWGEQERLDDAVSVATLALLEYWIPRFANEDTRANFNFAVRYGCHRVTGHLLSEFEDEAMRVSIDGDPDDESPLSDTLADPSPTPEDIACSDAVVADVRRLVDELDWQACLSEESSRQEAKRTGRSQMTVVRHRKRARNCVRAAYLSAI